MKSRYILAGDIGGTKTNLAIFKAATPDADTGAPMLPLAETTCRSADYPDLETLVADFLGQQQFQITSACFGVAGPVINGRSRITKLPWEPDEQLLQTAFGLERVRLVNDLVATAYAIPILSPTVLATLNPGEPVRHGAIGILAPGTGLGEALMTWTGTGYTAHASEGGHADFAPTTAGEIELLRFLLQRFGHVSYDRVCSGSGLANIYAFLKESGQEEPEWLAAQMSGADDPAPLIVDAAREAVRPCELCRSTLMLFTAILGAESGNLGLRGMTTGGIYLGGGIPAKILDFLRAPAFMAAFASKGRMSQLAARIPVHVILDPKAALLGAARHALAL